MPRTTDSWATRLYALTATEIVHTIAAGKATCEMIAQACLERIHEREPYVQAWQYLDAKQVLAIARALDQRRVHGPLHGVPFGVKDIIDTCDMPTEYGSPIYQGHHPASDAACVALSRRAGAVLMGKTVTTEFANRHPGKTRHPRDPQRTPGGSSSGSAAAVGDCMVPLALGTQTTGSTIRPASFCGVFGYRPSYGDLRCVGVKEAAGSLDTLGLFARSIADLALYRDVLLGIPPEPLPDAPATPLRIGFCRTHVWSMVEPTTQRRLEDAAQQLAKAGAQVEEVTLPPEFAQIEEAQRWIASFEFARNLTWEIDHHWEQISDELKDGRLQDGLACGFERYGAARDFAQACRGQFADLCAPYDMLLTAAATGEAPLGWQTGNASPCAIWTTLYVPALTVPVFTGPNGLPVGAQLIGKRNQDRALFVAAHWVFQHFT
jgi:Asp-tRNA(Asn)/Glu-tRNA(Gln) amidotransferase A subunit family amidase